MKYKKVKDYIYSYERESGTRYRVRYTYMDKNKRKERSKSGFHTLTQAESYLMDIQSLVTTRGTEFLRSKATTFSDHWERYKTMKINNRSWNKVSMANAEVKIKPWIEEFGELSFDEIYPEDVQDYIHQLFDERNYSQETMKSYFGMFMQVVNDALDEGILLRNPYRKVSWKRLDDWQPRKKVIELSDFKTFMRLARQQMRPDVYRCIYLLTFGLRRREAYGVKVEDIVEVEGITVLHINTSRTREYLNGKGVKSARSNRVIVLDELGAEMMQEQINFARKIKADHGQILHASDFIFISPNSGTPYPLKTLENNIKEITEQMDINYNITPHMFRHTLATYASASGVDNMLIQNYLGHADAKMTMHYTHASIQGAQAVTEASQILRG